MSCAKPGRRGVLVADDDPAALDSLQYVLDRAGYHVLAVRDGQEAVRFFREHHRLIGLVLLDMSMPVMDGEQAFRRLRALDPSAHVALMGTRAAHALVDRLMREGLAGFLPKPVQRHDLLAIVACVLDGELPTQLPHRAEEVPPCA